MRLIATSLAALFLLLSHVPSALGQEAASPATEAPPADERQRIESLIQTIEDEGRRQELVDTLRTLLEAESVTGSVEETRSEGLLDQIVLAFTGKFSEIASQTTALIGAVERVPELAEWVRQQATVPILRRRWSDIGLSLAIVFGTGLAVRYFAVALLRRWRRTVSRITPTSHARAIVPILGKLALDTLPIIAFAGACSVAIGLVAPAPSVRTVLLAGIEALLAAGLATVAIRALTSPHSQPLRVLPMSDETAAYMLIWVTRLAYVAAFGYFVWRAGFALGLSGGAEGALLFLTNLVFTGLMIVFILQNRAPFAHWLRGSGQPERRVGRTIGALRRRLAEVWHVVAIAYVLGAFLVDTIGVKGGLTWIGRATILSLLVLIAAQLAAVVLSWGLDRAFSVGEETRRRFPTLQMRANRYLSVFRHVLNVAIAIVAALALLETWGLGGLSWIGTEAGRTIVAAIGSILFVVVISIIVWEVSSTLIERQLTRSDASGHPIPLSGRARTLLPLLRNIILVALVTVASLIILSELGLNIAPLLAGAGVIGLAVGFGAQTLVKDVITGLFILIEDTISVGDVVDVGGHSGVVEGMTIRTIRLRDVAGAVHTIPFSTVASVINMTKDFSFYVFDVGVSYRMDVDRVVQVLKGLGDEIRNDPALGPDILEPLEIIGLDRFDESAVVIKARIKTLPIRQWAVGREFNRLMKRRFDEEGIEMPFPHRTLTLSADSAKLVAGAAREPGQA